MYFIEELFLNTIQFSLNICPDTLEGTNTNSYQNIWLHTELIRSDTLDDTNTESYQNFCYTLN